MADLLVLVGVKQGRTLASWGAIAIARGGSPRKLKILHSRLSRRVKRVLRVCPATFSVVTGSHRQLPLSDAGIRATDGAWATMGRSNHPGCHRR
jgi:hypothetical protein